MSNKVKRVMFKRIENKNDSNLEKYEEEFDYLVASGIANQTYAVSNPVFPLNESTSKNLVKLYYNDVGILTNLLYKNNIKAILKNVPKLTIHLLSPILCVPKKLTNQV